MNNHVNATMAEALRGHMPPGWHDTPVTEAARVHADIQHQRHREHIRESMELAQQIREQSYPGRGGLL